MPDRTANGDAPLGPPPKPNAPDRAWNRLPKAELHLHLRGAMPVPVFTDLLNQHSVDEILQGVPTLLRRFFQRCENIRPFLAPRAWTPGEVTRLFQYESFEHFLATYAFTGLFFRRTEDLAALVQGVLRALEEQNIVYAEITIALINYLRQGLSLEDVARVLENAARAGGPVRVQWIVDLVRDLGPRRALRLLDRVIGLKCPSIVGITLGGSENLFPPDLFKKIYARARDCGLRLTVHAGEALGPESVWDAVRLLRAERIGHGIRAAEDAALVRLLAERRLPLEVCLTSNIKTGVVSSYQAHPVRALLEAGVPITISTDDPTFFETSLAGEFDRLARLGVAEEDIRNILDNGFAFAFLPEEDKRPYREALARAWPGRALRPALGSPPEA